MYLWEKVRGVVSIKILKHLVLGGLLLVPASIDSSTSRSEQPLTVEVLVERVERVSSNEADFRVRVTNRSGQPVFLTVINYESGSRLDPMYLEQLPATGGWKIVYPCMDTPPPDVIKLDRAKPAIQNLVLKVPLEGVCKERNIRLDEGTFRFRLDYFESEEEARIYMKKFFSKNWQEAHAAVARSGPFKIPSQVGN